MFCYDCFVILVYSLTISLLDYQCLFSWSQMELPFLSLDCPVFFCDQLLETFDSSTVSNFI